MKRLPRLFVLLLAGLDALWAWQALGSVRPYGASNVNMVNLILWSFFHLPAAALGSWLLSALGAMPADPSALGRGGLALLGGLGVVQAAGLGWLGARWWERRREAR